jgi:zinc protease
VKQTRRVFMLALAGALGLGAQPAAPSIDSLIDAYVKAIGGAGAIGKMTSRHTKGTMEMAAMGVKATMEFYAKAPNKTLLKAEIPGLGLIQEGYDGSVAWAFNSAQGMREKSGVELAVTRRSAEMHRDLKLKELYPKMEIAGSEKVGDKDAWHVVATPVEGAPEHWYIDKATSLLIRSKMELEGPMGKLEIVTDMQDYREVEGVKLPWTVKQQAGPVEVVLKFEDVKVNVPLDDAMFRKPATP